MTRGQQHVSFSCSLFVEDEYDDEDDSHSSFSCPFAAPRSMKITYPLGEGGLQAGLKAGATHPGAPRPPSLR